MKRPRPAPTTALQAPHADTSWLRTSFVEVQSKLRSDMKHAAQSISHAGTMGGVNEAHWRSLFRAYLPNRYDVASGIIVVSLGGRSEQIDLVVFDPQYTPTLLDQKDHRYIPAEAVYAMFECKPNINKQHVVYAQNKAASVRRLHRTSAPIANAGGTPYPPRTPFRIAAGLLALRADWKDGLGKSFEKCMKSDNESRLDCGCTLDHGCFDTYGGTLSIATEQGALMYFLFGLLSHLQSRGTVTAIDWAAYSKIIR